jgi:hypothetical protein
MNIELTGILSEGYGIVPKKIMKANISIGAKALLCYMLTYTGGGKAECFPSVETICKHLNSSKPTIVKLIKELVDSELIEKTRLYPNDPLRRNNKYVIKIFNNESKKSEPSEGKEFELSREELFTYNNTTLNKTRKSNNKDNFSASTDQKDETVQNKREEKIRRLLDIWNGEKIYIHDFEVAVRYMKKKHIDLVEVYGIEEFKAAVKNYAEIISDDDYWFTHKWAMWDFIMRGLHKFVDKVDPHEQYLKNEKKVDLPEWA